MEQMSITRTETGGLLVELQTDLGTIGTLLVRKLLPSSPNLGQLQLLELQADLMEAALKELQHKVQAARSVDRSQARGS